MESKNNKKNLVIAVIALGALCGLAEVVVGNWLRNAGFPYRSGLLTGIGLAVLGFGIAIFKKPLMAIGIAFVAILVKQMTVPILGVSVMCKMNASIAVMLEYAALGGLGALFFNKIKGKGIKNKALVGGGAAFTGAVSFYFIGMQVAPCKYLLSFAGLTGFGSYLSIEALSWTLFSAVLFPVGWKMGEKASSSVIEIMESKPAVFYAVSAVTVIFSVAVSGMVISKGL
ncbi:MAG: hypothetical protein PF545_04065 [Elusimicrobia bacterium]|jgi:hypothetical protein|nr:hypothetical protein [Elusimicrobiota bacterium]